MSETVVIGDATLIHGDCREVLPLLPKHDLLLTDPPYGIDKKISVGGGPHTKTKTKFHNLYKAGPRWDIERPGKDLFELMFSTSRHQIVCGANYFCDMLPVSRGWVFWDKMGAGMSSVNDELLFTSLDVSMKVFRRCHGLDKGFLNKDGQWHPTQKPTELMKWCILQVPGVQSVLDPFAGSGTTGVACVHLGVNFTGIERERKYFDIACERISRAQAQGRMFEPEPIKAEQGALL